MKKPAAIVLVTAILSCAFFPVLSVFANDADVGLSKNMQPATASAGVTLDSPQGEAGVADYKDLQDWLSDNNNSGKAVTFSDTITIPAGESLFIHDTVLNTVNHGLIIEGSIRSFGVKITGKSTENPVVTIRNEGRLDISSRQSEISATGGGTAVKIENNGTLAVLTGWCVIRSEGANAVGIDTATELSLSDTFIASDNIGIKADGVAELFLCGIDAPVPIAANGAVVLDTCFVSETVENAVVINGKITDIVQSDEFYSVLVLGADISPNLFGNALTVVLENDEDKSISIPVSWDLSKVDTNTAGIYEVAGTILAPYDCFGLDSEEPLTATVEIADTSLPVLCDTAGWGGKYYLYFLYDIYSDLSALTLWRSDDDGASWYVHTANIQRWYDDTLMLTFSDIPQHPVLLVFEVEGRGESNVLRIVWNEDGFSANLGGDRNGLDRGGEDDLPQILEPDPKPEPEPEPESESETKPERESNSKSTRSSSRTWPDFSVSTDTKPVLPTSDDTAPSNGVALPAEATVAKEASADIPGQSEAARASSNEFENDATTAVSGERLRMMINAGSKVTFIKEDVRLSFASSALEALDIKNGQLFMVTVARLEQMQYTMTASLDGTVLENLPCVVTLDGNSFDIFVSGTYDFAQLSDTHEAVLAEMRVPDTATPRAPVEATGIEPENQSQSTAETPFAGRKLVFAILGPASIAGTAAAILKVRVRRHGR